MTGRCSSHSSSSASRTSGEGTAPSATTARAWPSPRGSTEPASASPGSPTTSTRQPAHRWRSTTSWPATSCSGENPRRLDERRPHGHLRGRKPDRGGDRRPGAAQRPRPVGPRQPDAQRSPTLNEPPLDRSAPACTVRRVRASPGARHVRKESPPSAPSPTSTGWRSTARCPRRARHAQRCSSSSGRSQSEEDRSGSRDAARAPCTAATTITTAS